MNSLSIWLHFLSSFESQATHISWIVQGGSQKPTFKKTEARIWFCLNLICLNDRHITCNKKKCEPSLSDFFFLWKFNLYFVCAFCFVLTRCGQQKKIEGTMPYRLRITTYDWAADEYDEQVNMVVAVVVVVTIAYQLTIFNNFCCCINRCVWW